MQTAPEIRAAFRRAAEAGTLHHAWIVHGKRGIGKAEIARTLAADLLGCAPDAQHPDLRVVEPDDKGSIGIDAVRGMTRALRATAVAGGWRVAIINPADAMTESAANGLLKTLEEAPRRTVILMVTGAPGHLPATIRSRCLAVRVAPPDPAEAVRTVRAADETLSERLAAALVEMADGSPGEALRLARDGGVDVYKDLLAIVAALPRLDRRAIQAFAQKHGVDNRWGTATEIVQAFLWRAACPAEPRGAGRGGAAEVMAKVLPADRVPAAMATTWEHVQGFFADARDANLDKRYALVRAFLALEFVVAQAAR